MSPLIVLESNPPAGTFVDDMESAPTSAYKKALVESGPKEIPLIDIGEARTFKQERIGLTN